MGNDLYTPVLAGHLDAVEAALPGFLPRADDEGLPLGGRQRTVLEAMAYACAAGGKRLRPVLTLEFCRLCGGEPAMALPFACAVEMIHCYSLVHDDLPCMDNSPLRRGRPSTFAAFGEDMGLLAGDALLNRAFEVMLDARVYESLPVERGLAAARCLAGHAGAHGMVGGQVIDLQSEHKRVDLDTLEQLQRGKTAALITAACEMGALVAGGGAQGLDAARTFGEQFGLAFQIVDDILDAVSTPEAMGKPTGSDTEHEKSTYVTLLGLEEARKLAAARTQKAIDALSVFGNNAQDLRQMTEMFYNRKR